MSVVDIRKWGRSLQSVVLANRYQLQKLLGAGGMGAVFQAIHTQTQRPVAIKLLHPELLNETAAVQRFHQEAKTAASIAQKGVVNIIDLDFDAEHGPFIAMDLLRGSSLAQHLRRHGRFSIQRALEISRDILRTLEYVHGRNIIHRDLKPANIFLAESEFSPTETKILDFGVSRIADTSSATRLTQTGVLLGTVRFMPPEQVKGAKTVDHRADLYAVGAILYSMLSGRKPYADAQGAAVLIALHQGPPRPLAELVPDITPSLVQMVERAMARDIDARYASASEFLRNIEKQLETTTAEPPQKRQRTSSAPPSLLRPKERIVPSESSPNTSPATATSKPSAETQRTSDGFSSKSPPHSTKIQQEITKPAQSQPWRWMLAGSLLTIILVAALAAIGWWALGSSNTPSQANAGSRDHAQQSMATATPANNTQSQSPSTQATPEQDQETARQMHILIETADRFQKMNDISAARANIAEALLHAKNSPPGPATNHAACKAYIVNGNLETLSLGANVVQEPFPAYLQYLNEQSASARTQYEKALWLQIPELRACAYLGMGELSERTANISIRYSRAAPTVDRLIAAERDTIRTYLESAESIFELAMNAQPQHPTCSAEARTALQRVRRTIASLNQPSSPSGVQQQQQPPSWTGGIIGSQ